MSEESEVWRPTPMPPKRAAGIPDSASWEDEGWRWADGATNAAAERQGTWRFWAMNGALLGERTFEAGIERSAIAYYPNGEVAARSQPLAHDAFYADGKPWSSARYLASGEVVSEKLWARDGSVRREVTNDYDGAGLVAHREHVDGLRFENLRTDGGRELRFYSNKGELEVTLRVRPDGVVARVDRDRELALDGAGIGEATRRQDIEGELGGRLFAVTIAGMPQPEAVKAFASRNAWARKPAEDAPFANASVANFLTGLTSKVPHVAEVSVLGIANLVTEPKHRAKVIPVLEAIGNDAAKEALERLREEDGDAEPEEHEHHEHDHSGEHPIGTVTLPSGDLVLTDMGAMAQWSHEEPHHADISGSSWAKVAGKSHDDFMDLVVRGPQAKEGLALFAREHGAGLLFDTEKPHAERTMARFKSLIGAAGLNASLELAPQRIGHGARLRLLKAAGLEYAEFSFAHVNVVGVFGLPADRELPIVGEHDDDGRWEYVSLVCRPSAAVSEEKIASLSVEEARFMFADAEALESWDHERSTDGLRDIVFWGRAEDDVAEATGAELAYDGATYYGWVDLPPGACPPHIVQRIFKQVDEGGLALEIRPHSSHHAILREAWTSAHEAGTARIGGAKITGLFTSVGDGLFPVFLERDADGEICRVTVKITSAPDDED